MPRLVLVNGPPAIGKSTLAQRYVDRHATVLNLDIDLVRRLIGGWRDDFTTSGELVRPLAVSLAQTHLRAGHDVVMPQYLGRLSEIAKFETAARECGAEFVEVLLMDTRDECLRRFTARSEAPGQLWHREVKEVVDAGGGLALLGDMYDRLIEVSGARPNAVVIPSVTGAIEQTYRTLERLLDG
jgi:predicted kinase